MRLMLHIFRKDLWMMRWAVLLAPVELGLWAWAEVTAGGAPSHAANSLRSAIVMAWCYFPGFLAMGESLTDRSQDWHTRPIPRWGQLGAKLLFTAVVFHLPYLLACAAILWGKGFAPWNHVGRLMELQGMAAAFLTLPSLALAAVTPGVGHYLGIGLLLSLTAMATEVAGPRERGVLLFHDPLQMWWWFVLLVVSALGVLVAQFLYRRTEQARVAGVAAVVMLVTSYLFVPEAPLDRLRCDGSVAGWRGNVGLAGEGRRVEKSTGERDTYLFRLAVPEESEGRLVKAALTSWTMRTEHGERFRRGKAAPVDMDLEGAEFQVRLDKELAAYRKDARVEMEMSAKVDVVRGHRPEWRRAGSSWKVPGLGNCGTILEDGETYGKLRVYCESPEMLSRHIPVRVHARDRNWREKLDADNSYVTYSWLIPVRRAEIFPLFVLAREPERKRWKWEATRSEVEDAAIEFEPQTWLGCEMVDFRISGRWDHAAGRFWPVMERK